MVMSQGQLVLAGSTLDAVSRRLVATIATYANGAVARGNNEGTRTERSTTAASPEGPGYLSRFLLIALRRDV